MSVVFACQETPMGVDPVAGPQMEVTAAASNTIDLNVVRFSGGSNQVLVSSGIPLAQGMLTPGQSDRVRLMINGTEKPIDIQVLRGRHRDGSVRSVLVQFRHAVPAGGMRAQLVIGQSRTTTDITVAQPTYTYTRPLPQAAALPSSPAYLISTGIFGKTTTAPDAFNARYESNFYTYGDNKWNRFISKYGSSLTVWDAENANYYDRAYIDFAWWARTGDEAQWRRAIHYLIAYRELFLKPRGYRVPPAEVNIDGLEAHYLLTGDGTSHNAVRVLAHEFYRIWLPVIGSLSSKYTANRIQARALDAYMTASRLDIRQHDYASVSRQALTRILGTQRADGSYRFKSSCQQQLNFQTGLLNDALVEYYEVIAPDSRIPGAIRRSLDFLWNTQWLPAQAAFKYISGYCSSQGSPKAAPDLNMLIVSPFGWYAQHSGQTKYRQHGDIVFNGGVQRAWLNGEKQYNQNYRSSYRYLFYRH